MLRQSLTTLAIVTIGGILLGYHASSARASEKAASATGAPYTCRYASGPITIDGKLDEAAWKKAGTIKTFYPFQPKNPPVLSPTKVRFLWDDKNFYACYECQDDDIWSFSDKNDDPLWNGDVGELFIKPSAKGLRYYEFVVAPSGAIADGRYPSRGAGGFNRFKGWSSHAKVATTVNGTDGDPTDDDRGYTIEVAIPLSIFTAAEQPRDGASWTFSAFRYDYSKSFEQPLLLMSIPEARGNGFHSYEGFGPLNFVK